LNSDQINGGYILLSRKIIDSEIFKKPPLYLKVWIYLLSSAQHKDYKGLKRGQLFTSIPDIQEACSHMVGYRKVTPTKDQIYNILEWLRKRCESQYESNDSTTMITTTKATHGLLINIDKYCVYQNPKSYESNDEPNNENATKELREQRQPNNINKNDKNDNNDNNKKICRFTPPSVEEIMIYCTERNNSVDCQKFYDFYTANGWVQGKGKPIKDWKACVRTWERSGKGKDQPQKQASSNKFNSFPQRNYSPEYLASLERRAQRG
jgi:hypothetical protein